MDASLQRSKYYHYRFNIVYVTFIATCTTYVVIQNELTENPLWKNEKYMDYLEIYLAILFLYFLVDNLWFILWPCFQTKKTIYLALLHHFGIMFVLFAIYSGYDYDGIISTNGAVSMLMEWSTVVICIKAVWKLDNKWINGLNISIWFITRIIFHPIAIIRLSYRIFWLAQYNTFVLICYLRFLYLAYLQVLWTYGGIYTRGDFQVLLTLLSKDKNS